MSWITSSPTHVLSFIGHLRSITYPSRAQWELDGQVPNKRLVWYNRQFLDVYGAHPQVRLSFCLGDVTVFQSEVFEIK